MSHAPISQAENTTLKDALSHRTHTLKDVLYLFSTYMCVCGEGGGDGKCNYNIPLKKWGPLHKKISLSHIDIKTNN